MVSIPYLDVNRLNKLAKEKEHNEMLKIYNRLSKSYINLTPQEQDCVNELKKRIREYDFDMANELLKEKTLPPYEPLKELEKEKATSYNFLSFDSPPAAFLIGCVFGALITIYIYVSCIMK